ncbi:MAG: two-component system, NtrC family, sensor kinase [Pseudomonadota bacterium]|nr:two-component system, NtrC family, sensor kinase [Pseudomonadota bacterium]
MTVAARPRRFVDSLRGRLMALGVLPVLIAVPLLVVVLVLASATYDRLLTQKVRADLATASNYFDHVVTDTGHGVQALAGSAELAELAVLKGEHGADPAAGLASLLGTHRAELALDFLCLLDLEMRVQRCTGALAPGQAYGDWPVVQSARQGQARSELDVLEAPVLEALAPGRAAQVRTVLRPTASARLDPRREETRALVIHAAAPVYRAGRLSALLVGGNLLSGNMALVERLDGIVYPPGALPEDGLGNATLFLGDVRVATTVRERSGERAVGTRVSAAVHDAVLGRGERWTDRAFVVNDWYVSGYRPLDDSRGQRVGMLYVGFLEAPFAATRRHVLTLVIGVFAVTLAVALWLGRRLSLTILRPVERMHQVMSAVEAGALSSRVDLREPGAGDELGELAAHFDRLLQRLDEQTHALREHGRSLDAQVAERTRALEDTLAELHRAQSQMIRQEQLAAVGQLTAGVAHEINNPVAVIQGNLDLMRERLGEAAEPVRHEIGLIREQVQRIRLIVARLLQFSRPSEYASATDRVEPKALVQDCLLLVGHLLRRSRIAVEQQGTSVRVLQASRTELQQVLVNLMVNAIQAMPERGVLRLTVKDHEAPDRRAGVRFEIADTGPGIAPELLERLFQPFFTTKQHGAGTGLGLWVSRTLVERAGGCIGVESEPGQGACFSVWWPAV